MQPGDLSRPRMTSSGSALSEIEEALRTRQVEARRLLDERRDRSTRDGSAHGCAAHRRARKWSKRPRRKTFPRSTHFRRHRRIRRGGRKGIGGGSFLSKLEEGQDRGRGHHWSRLHYRPGLDPLFPIAAGLVTEVSMPHDPRHSSLRGGLQRSMGVDGATDAIRDRTLIRVNGTHGGTSRLLRR